MCHWNTLCICSGLSEKFRKPQWPTGQKVCEPLFCTQIKTLNKVSFCKDWENTHPCNCPFWTRHACRFLHSFIWQPLGFLWNRWKEALSIFRMSFLCLLSPSFPFTVQQLVNTCMMHMSWTTLPDSTCYVQTLYCFTSKITKQTFAHIRVLHLHCVAICTYIFALFAYSYISFVFFSQTSLFENKNWYVCKVWGILKSTLESFQPSPMWVLLMSE